MLGEVSSVDLHPLVSVMKTTERGLQCLNTPLSALPSLCITRWKTVSTASTDDIVISFVFVDFLPLSIFRAHERRDREIRYL